MNNIKQLLDLNIEIEGLLRVAEIHNSAAIETLLLSKANKFYEILNSEINIDKHDHEIKGEMPTDSDSQSESQDSEPETEVKSPSVNDADSQTSINAVTESSEETVLEMSYNQIDKLEDDVDPVTPPLFIPYLHKQNKEQENTSPEKYLMYEDEGHVMRVDEMIHRQSSRDLKKAFSINDRFRYIREIFGNDSACFDQTLSYLDTLPNIDEVYDYLLGEMNLNHEDPTVKEFLSIIFNHFNA